MRATNGRPYGLILDLRVVRCRCGERCVVGACIARPLVEGLCVLSFMRWWTVHAGDQWSPVRLNLRFVCCTLLRW